jgi:hypothetical protein
LTRHQVFFASTTKNLTIRDFSFNSQLARGLGEAIDEHAFKWDDMLRLLGEFGRQFAAAHKAAAAVLLNEKKSALVSDVRKPLISRLLHNLVTHVREFC